MQWRIVVKMAGRAAKISSLVEHIGFLPWLFLIISGVSNHSSGPNPVNIIIFSCSFTSVSLDSLCTYLQATVNNLFATAGPIMFIFINYRQK